jgi:hypothetical protein
MTQSHPSVTTKPRLTAVAWCCTYSSIECLFDIGNKTLSCFGEFIQKTRYILKRSYNDGSVYYYHNHGNGIKLTTRLCSYDIPKCALPPLPVVI